MRGAAIDDEKDRALRAGDQALQERDENSGVDAPFFDDHQPIWPPDPRRCAATGAIDATTITKIGVRIERKHGDDDHEDWRQNREKARRGRSRSVDRRREAVFLARCAGARSTMRKIVRFAPAIRHFWNAMKTAALTLPFSMIMNRIWLPEVTPKPGSWRGGCNFGGLLNRGRAFKPSQLPADTGRAIRTAD
jgi:hypothetical protein